MSSKLLVCDIDGTVSDFVGPFSWFCRDVLGDERIPLGCDWDCPCPVPRAEFRVLLEQYEATDGYAGQKPYIEGRAALRRLVSAGWRVVYVTARDGRWYDATRLWLLTWGFPFHGLLCVGKHKPKAVVLRTLRASAWVEDVPQDVGAGCGVPLVLVRRSWNVGAAHRRLDWPEIAEELTT